MLTGPGGERRRRHGGRRRARARSSSARRPHEQLRVASRATPNGPGFLLRRGRRRTRDRRAAPTSTSPDLVADGVPVALREHLLSGVGEPEHRHGDGRVRPLRRRRRARRDARLGRPSPARSHELVRAAQAAADARRRHVPRHRHRPRRRQDHPRRGRADVARRRRGPDAARRSRAIVDATDDAAGPRRREPRARLRRRHRSVVPAHVHGDGRHREPRGPAHGQGRARPDHRHRRRARRVVGTRSRPTRSSPSWSRARRIPLHAFMVGHSTGSKPETVSPGVPARRSRRGDGRVPAGAARAPGRAWLGARGSSGTPGMGKTRLLSEFRAEAPDLPHLVSAASSTSPQVAYLPVPAAPSTPAWARGPRRDTSERRRRCRRTSPASPELLPGSRCSRSSPTSRSR